MRALGLWVGVGWRNWVRNFVLKNNGTKLKLMLLRIPYAMRKLHHVTSTRISVLLRFAPPRVGIMPVIVALVAKCEADMARF